MFENYLYGIMTGGGAMGLVIYIISWIRFRGKDRANVLKTLSEAYEIKMNTEAVIADEWRKINAELKAQLQHERQECDREIHELKEKILRLEKKIDSLKNPPL